MKIMNLPLIRCANSICFSLDGTLMFHTDSPSREIQCYNYNRSTGQIGRSNTFVVLQQEKLQNANDRPIPDGSIIDSLGNLWNSEWNGARVVLYKPSILQDNACDIPIRCVGKEILAEVRMPVPRVTCCCLGGPSMDWLFITTGLSSEEGSGGLYVARVDIPGVPESRFCDC